MDKLVLVLATLALAAGLYVSNIQIGVTLGQELGLTAKYVDGPLPITSPDAPIWGDIEAKEVELGPQLTAAPWIHPEPSVRSLRVKVIHNGTWVSFLLEWNDATKDDKMLTDTFRDSAAVMLALQPGAGQCMGTPTAEVVIAHWKADWQRDVNEAFTDISELYPNFWSDWYPFAVGSPPYTLPDLMNLSAAKEYFAGWYAGNPLSTPLKLTPVETLVAHGWGTLTTYAYQSFIGRGIHDGAKWSVVISRPISTGQADPPWGDGGPVEVAFAVWDGSNGEIGAKKGVSLPMPLSLEKPTKPTAVTATVTVTETGVEAAPPVQNQALIIIAIVAAVMAFLIIGIILPGRKKKRGSAE